MHLNPDPDASHVFANLASARGAMIAWQQAHPGEHWCRTIGEPGALVVEAYEHDIATSQVGAFVGYLSDAAPA